MSSHPLMSRVTFACQRATPLLQRSMAATAAQMALWIWRCTSSSLAMTDRRSCKRQAVKTQGRRQFASFAWCECGEGVWGQLQRSIAATAAQMALWIWRCNSSSRAMSDRRSCMAVSTRLVAGSTMRCSLASVARQAWTRLHCRSTFVLMMDSLQHSHTERVAQHIPAHPTALYTINQELNHDGVMQCMRTCSL